jgi:pimeloyl-ACP methyl ester carboxylesterase
MYATLFPSRVRSFVLDSPVYVTRDRRERFRDVAVAADDALTQFFAWCATSPKCTFGPAAGRTPDAIAAAYDSLVTTLDAAPLTTPTRPLDGSGVRYATLFQQYAPLVQWTALGNALADAASGDGSALRKIVDSNVAPSDAASENFFSAFLAIANADGPLPAGFTQAQLRAYIEGELPALGPRLGAVGPTNELPYFIDWPIAVAHVPPLVSAKSAPPLLLTATRHDPATPYGDAAKLQAALGNGSYVVTYEGSGHTNAGLNPCLGVAATVFLLDPAKAPTTTSCPKLDP